MTKNVLNHDFWWYFIVISGSKLTETVLEEITKNGFGGGGQFFPPSVRCGRMSIYPDPDRPRSQKMTKRWSEDVSEK